MSHGSIARTRLGLKARLQPRRPDPKPVYRLHLGLRSPSLQLQLRRRLMDSPRCRLDLCLLTRQRRASLLTWRMARFPVLGDTASTLSLHLGIGTPARRPQGQRGLPRHRSLTRLQRPIRLPCLTHSQLMARGIAELGSLTRARRGFPYRDPLPPPVTKGLGSPNTPEPRPSPKRLRPQLRVLSRRALSLLGRGRETS